MTQTKNSKCLKKLEEQQPGWRVATAIGRPHDAPLNRGGASPVGIGRSRWGDIKMVTL